MVGETNLRQLGTDLPGTLQSIINLTGRQVLIFLMFLIKIKNLKLVSTGFGQRSGGWSSLMIAIEKKR